MASGLLFMLVFSTMTLLPSISSESLIKLPSKGAMPGNRKIKAGDHVYCDSWRLSVETNNAGTWEQIRNMDRRLSVDNARFVEDYMNGERYRSDSDVIASISSAFANNVKLGGDGREAWVFDVDETLLSNLPYYEDHGFGSAIFNETSFDDWVSAAKAPALPASLRFYKELQQLGFKIFLLTGRSEYQRKATEANLLFSGYTNYKKLILRGELDQGKAATVYKSERRQELVNDGYRIHGSSGDQWSDLMGFAVATRSFKLPNPMYFIL